MASTHFVQDKGSVRTFRQAAFRRKFLGFWEISRFSKAIIEDGLTSPPEILRDCPLASCNRFLSAICHKTLTSNFDPGFQEMAPNFLFAFFLPVYRPVLEDSSQKIRSSQEEQLQTDQGLSGLFRAWNVPGESASLLGPDGSTTVRGPPGNEQVQIVFTQGQSIHGKGIPATLMRVKRTPQTLAL